MAPKQEHTTKFVAVLDSDAQWELTALLPDGSRRRATPAESVEEEAKHRKGLTAPQLKNPAKGASDRSNPETCEMMNTELAVHRRRLLALRATIRGDVTQMEDVALNQDHSKTTSMPSDMAELGTDNFDQELTLRVLRIEEGTLAQIESALQRIEDGAYGLCAECGGQIPKSRLNAIPYATECVRCASQREHRNEAVRE